jgi:hypothetical protein
MDIPEDITSIDQLRWYRMVLVNTRKKKKIEVLQPCRVLSPGEAAKCRRNNLISNDTRVGGGTVIQYLKHPDIERGLYKCVDDSSLIPFGYASRDGLSATFNDDYLRRYTQQEGKTVPPLNLERTRIFLKRAFDHAIETERKMKEQSEKDLREYYDGSSDDGANNIGRSGERLTKSKRVQFEVLDGDDDAGNYDDGDNHDDMDDLDIPYTQAITFDPDDFGTVEGPSNEPIRPGDVIEYYCPIFVSGDARGLRHATVLSVDPNDSMPLVLSNGEGLPRSTKVKRIKVMSGNELVDHPGIFRAMDRFKLTKRGSATAADAITMEASRFGAIMKKKINRLREKAEADGFAPMDMLVNIRGVTTNPNSPNRTKALSDSTLRGKKRESLLSSFADDISDSEAPKITIKPATIMTRIDRLSDAISRTGKISGNEENNQTDIGDEKKSRAWNHSSSASSGLSLATSDEGSYESPHINLGKNHKKMTQCENSTLPKRKLKANSWSDANTYDLSLSSDDDETEKRNTRQKRMGKSNNATTKGGACSSNSPVKTSPTTSFASLKRLSKRSSAHDYRYTEPSSQSSSHSNNDKDEKGSTSKALRRKELILSSTPPSSTSSLSTNTSSIRKLAKAETKTKTESTRLKKHLSSSDAVKIPNGNTSNPTSKKRPLPSSDSSSFDDGDDVVMSKPHQIRDENELIRRIQSVNGQMRDSLESIDRPRKLKERMESAGECQIGNLDFINTGWTRGKAGWEKSSNDGSGFRFGRYK